VDPEADWEVMVCKRCLGFVASYTWNRRASRLAKIRNAVITSA